MLLVAVKWERWSGFKKYKPVVSEIKSLVKIAVGALALRGKHVHMRALFTESDIPHFETLLVFTLVPMPLDLSFRLQLLG